MRVCIFQIRSPVSGIRLFQWRCSHIPIRLIRRRIPFHRQEWDTWQGVSEPDLSGWLSCFSQTFNANWLPFICVPFRFPALERCQRFISTIDDLNYAHGIYTPKLSDPLIPLPYIMWALLSYLQWHIFDMGDSKELVRMGIRISSSVWIGDIQDHRCLQSFRRGAIWGDRRKYYQHVWVFFFEGSNSRFVVNRIAGHDAASDVQGEIVGNSLWPLPSPYFRITYQLLLRYILKIFIVGIHITPINTKGESRVCLWLSHLDNARH